MPVSPRLAAWLAERGHDAVHVSAVGLERASDRAVLAHAADEHRVLITADTDFPQLLALSGDAVPGVVLFRGGGYAVREMEGLLARVLASVGEDALARSVCVVDRHGIRCRRLPIK